MKPDPTGAGAIGLESRIQDAVGDAYRVLRELGGGGMSRVFLAEETRLSRQVVIKVLPPELVAGVPTMDTSRFIDGYALAPSLKRLGELYETRGDRRKAAEYYERFAELWKRADPELQPAVREVRARIAQLAQEPGP